MKQVKLSDLGKQAEKLLTATLEEMEEDAKAAKAALKSGKKYEAKFTLLDRMKVIDRVGKLEAIRAKLETPEGSFFSGGAQGDDDEPE